MAIFIDERRGSGDFDEGSGGGTGKVLFFVTGAADHGEAEAAALADPRAPDEINGYLQDQVSVAHQGGDLYFVDVTYRRAVPSETASPAAGQTPTDARPAPAGQDHSEPLGRDVTFTMGGGTRKVYQSLETLYKISREGEAPDFGQVIGYNRKTGEIEGCEVITSTSDFTITKRFNQLTLGWFRTNMDLVATVNEAPYLGCDKGEVLYKGADGQYKDGDPKPWTVTGRFGYGRNRANVPIDNPDIETADLIVPLIRGHEYVWVIYKTLEWPVTIDGVEQTFKVEKPQFVYVERGYNYPSDISDGRVHISPYDPPADALSFKDLGFG